MRQATLRVSPAESDTSEGVDVRLLDPSTWQNSDNTVQLSSPLEYRTLFDVNGLVFNTCQWGCWSPDGRLVDYNVCRFFYFILDFLLFINLLNRRISMFSLQYSSFLLDNY